ncbi:Homer 3 [Merluccius polli]|uniref:Homer 3 n=1 Tax=Merluccius polli TaxID=89951 RepID=A0AA47ME23_MERPO|nr:Homer 3 [Merluccius polli]
MLGMRNQSMLESEMTQKHCRSVLYLAVVVDCDVARVADNVTLLSGGFGVSFPGSVPESCLGQWMLDRCFTWLKRFISVGLECCPSRLFHLNIQTINMEQPLFSAKAHVFQIDPATKRNWLPASKHAVSVSFFYDANRNAYRIISVGGTKAIINSTITPNMTFTKTSHKFGQWADSRANTVYGLGFSTEQQLQQFSDQFKEVREAARLAREKSQERFELTNPALNIAAPQELSEERHSPPPLLTVNGPGEDKLIRSRSTEVELTSEKERIKKMLSEGTATLWSPLNMAEYRQTKTPMMHCDVQALLCCVGRSVSCELHMETELFTLQDSNAKLVSALQEAESSGLMWKKQLAEYQEETDRLREQVAELEAQSVASASSDPDLSQSVENLEALLKTKEQEIQSLQSKKTDASDLEQEKEEAMQRLQELEHQNAALEERVQSAETDLAASQEERQQTEGEVQRAIEVLDLKILDLSSLRQSLAKLIDK